jgi:peptidyl-prolyl cis-trans isomerase SurA
MKTKHFFLALISIFSLSFAHSQTKDPVLMKVGDKTVTKDEFKAIFTKNLKDSVITQQALDEYLVLFTKFKLKVTEAEARGLDTTKKFKEELAGYRKQLSRPYLTDASMSEELIKEAYERMKEEIRASHILIKCELDAAPKDTLDAYKKAIAIRERILKGEDFAKVASGKLGSEDPSAAKNGGDLGYFTALQMVYPFESACYKMKPGDVSMPIRTRFGYHIIKVTDRRAARGQVKVSHILISSRDEDDPAAKEAALKKANEILDKLKAGEDFSNLAKQFSDDGSSAKKGGDLPVFGPGKMVLEFEEASFALSNPGDLSGLVKSSYGYHIIKLQEKIPLQSFDEMKGQLKQKVSRDTRAVIPKKAFVDKLKKKYKFKETASTKDVFHKGVDTSILHGHWKKEYMMAVSSYVRPVAKPKTEEGLIKGLNEEENKKNEGKAVVEEKVPVDEKKVAALKKKIMFSFADKKFSQYDFAVYLEKNQRKDKEMELNKYIDASYRSWTQDELNNYEDSQLENIYPEFRLLMKEYRDGILLFELTDQMVWNKAVKDTAGLRAFYNERKTKYMWPVRYDADIYTCATMEIATNLNKDLANGYIEKEKVKPVEAETDKKGKSKNKKKQAEPEMEKHPLTSDLLREKYNKESQLNLKIENGKFGADDKEIFKKISLKPGISQIIEKDGQFVLVKIHTELQPMPKTLNEAKGVITADYQGFLEAKWIEELEKKYKVEVFKDVLYSIK